MSKQMSRFCFHPRDALTRRTAEGSPGPDVEQTASCFTYPSLRSAFGADSRLGRGHSVVAAVILALMITVNSAIILRVSSDLWFYGDEWDFIIGRPISADPVHFLFHPHNEHWSTVPLLLFKAIFHVFQMHEFLPYMIPIIVCQGLCSLLLYLILRRLNVGYIISLSLTSLFVFSGAGSNNLIWPFQTGFLIPVVLYLLSVFLLCKTETEGHLLQFALTIVGLMAIMSSGIGLVTVVGVTAALVARRHFRFAAVYFLVLIAIYAAWKMQFGQGTAYSSHGFGRLGLPAYIISGLNGTVDHFLPITGLSGILLVVLSYLCTRIGSVRGNRFTVAVSALVALGSLWLIIGYSRVALGLEQATESRYLYISLTFMLLIVGALLDKVVRIRVSGLQALSVVVVLIAVAINGQYVMYTYSRDLSNQLGAWKEDELAAAVLLSKGGEVVNQNAQVGDTNAGTIETLHARGWLPAPSEPPSDQQLADLATRMQLRFSSTPVGSLVSGRVIAGNGEAVSAGGCVGVAGTNSVARIAGDGLIHGITISSAGPLGLALQVEHGSADGTPATVSLAAGATGYLLVGSLGDVLVTAPNGYSQPVTVCNGTPPR